MANDEIRNEEEERRLFWEGLEKLEKSGKKIQLPKFHFEPITERVLTDKATELCQVCGADCYTWELANYVTGSKASAYEKPLTIGNIPQNFRELTNCPPELKYSVDNIGYFSDNFDCLIIFITEEQRQKIRPVTCEKCFLKILAGEELYFWDYMSVGCIRHEYGLYNPMFLQKVRVSSDGKAIEMSRDIEEE